MSAVPLHVSDLSDRVLVSLRGLLGGTWYNVTVTAESAAGNSSAVTVSALSRNASTPSSVPSLSVSDVSSTSVMVAWTVPDDSTGSPLTGFRLFVHSPMAPWWSGDAFELPASANSTRLPDLTPASSYVTSLVAVNALGTSPPVNASFTTLTVQPPEAIYSLGGDLVSVPRPVDASAAVNTTAGAWLDVAWLQPACNGSNHGHAVACANATYVAVVVTAAWAVVSTATASEWVLSGLASRHGSRSVVLTVRASGMEWLRYCGH